MAISSSVSFVFKYLRCSLIWSVCISSKNSLRYLFKSWCFSEFACEGLANQPTTHKVKFIILTVMFTMSCSNSSCNHTCYDHKMTTYVVEEDECWPAVSTNMGNLSMWGQTPSHSEAKQDHTHVILNKSKTNYMFSLPSIKSPIQFQWLSVA